MARFIDAHRIIVDGREYAADHIVIATGGRPVVPPVPGAELGITSDGFFQLEALPRKVAVIGAAYVGIELAGVLSALGSEFTLVAMERRVLEVFDELIGTVVATSMQQQGIALHLGFRVAALTETALVPLQDELAVCSAHPMGQCEAQSAEDFPPVSLLNSPLFTSAKQLP